MVSSKSKKLNLSMINTIFIYSRILRELGIINHWAQVERWWDLVRKMDRNCKQCRCLVIYIHFTFAFCGVWAINVMQLHKHCRFISTWTVEDIDLDLYVWRIMWFLRKLFSRVVLCGEQSYVNRKVFYRTVLCTRFCNSGFNLPHPLFMHSNMN